MSLFNLFEFFLIAIGRRDPQNFGFGARKGCDKKTASLAKVKHPFRSGFKRNKGSIDVVCVVLENIVRNI